MRSISSEALDIRIPEDDLPVLSAVATRVLSLLGDGDVDMKDLDALIRADPSLTSRILRLANSPLYGGKVKFTSLEQALVRLGMAELRRTVLIAATGEVFAQDDVHAQAFWEHSISVAIASHRIAEKTGAAKPDECFVSGMLHDIGKLVIYRQVPEAYGQMIEDSKAESTRFFQYEKKHIKYCTHETIGALVGRKWDLNAETLEVMRFHHNVETETEIAERSAPIVLLISYANLLANQLGYGNQDASLFNAAVSVPAQVLDISPEITEELIETLPEIIEEQKSAFS